MGYATPMFGPPVINPYGDHLPESPVDWADISLAPGTVAGPLGHLQHTHEGDPFRGTSDRRAPGYESLPVLSRWPERPA